MSRWLPRLVRTELLKARTVRSTGVLLVGTVVLVALTVVGTALSAGDAGSGEPSLATPDGLRNVAAAAGIATPFPLILGILMMAGEWQHHTISRALLLTPRRGRLVAAKLIAAGLLGSGFGLAAAAATLLTAATVLGAEGRPLSALLDRGVAQTLVSAVLALELYATLGVALGALLRSQVAAVALALAWLFVLEGVFNSAAPQVGKFLPGRAATAMLGAGGYFDTTELLPAAVGALLFAGYGVVLAVLAGVTAVRRDVP
jgi:ABC-type transport system involved in multi-copper enzyme maturation permease subunit